MSNELKVLDVDATNYIKHLEEINERYKQALMTIRWTLFASNPQSMIMKDIAGKALYLERLENGSRTDCEYCGEKYNVNESDAVEDKLYCSAICEVVSNPSNGFD